MFWCCSNFFLSFKKYRDLNSKEINLHFTEKCSENFYLGGAARCNQLSVTSWLPWPICTRSSPCMSDSTSLELRWWKSARPSTHYWPLQVRSAGPADLWIQHRWSDGKRQASSITPSINRVSLVISFFFSSSLFCIITSFYDIIGIMTTTMTAVYIHIQIYLVLLGFVRIDTLLCLAL
jgi:hypothetical protein